MAERSVLGLVPAQPSSDGAGVRLNRSLGSQMLQELDPFLLLDEFRSDDAADYIGGFPDHPHRGFETVTYMLAGNMRHKDNTGREGELKPGSVQWMTAGRGIVHSEMPEQVEGLMWGFQLWVNLPSARKMTEPGYQEFDADDIPVERHEDGTEIRVVAGTTDAGTVGAVSGIATAPVYLDIALAAGASVSQTVPEGHNGFVYPFEGSVAIGGGRIDRGHLAVLNKDGDRVTVEAVDGPARCLLVAGQPIGEPIARYGPFVMNTREELIQAVEDFQAGRF